jgi:Kef-type K+ transport system membrane component KefB
MSPHDVAIFVLQLALLLSVGLAAGWLARRAGQPAVLGEMIAGILLGPTLFGALAPDAFHALFRGSPAATAWRSEVARLSMFFFLFFVGLEIELHQLKAYGTRALAIGTSGCILPVIAGLGAVYAWPGLWGPQAQENRLAIGLFIGAAMANTANPVLARILLDTGLLATPLGAMLLTATLVDDLIGWSMLAVAFQQFSSARTSAHDQLLAVLGVGLFLVVVVALGRMLLLPLLLWSRRVGASLVGTTALLAAGVPVAAIAAERLGLHAFLGPFLLGIALAPSQQQLARAYQVLGTFITVFCVPIYFVSMGLTSDFVAHFDAPLVLVVVGVACLSKITSVFAAAALSGFNRRQALGIAFGMNARGAIGIILASLGREEGLIDDPVYVALVLMALATSLLAAPAMKHWLAEPPRAAPA